MPKLWLKSDAKKPPIEITADEYINSCGIFDNDQPSNEEEKFTKQVNEKLKNNGNNKEIKNPS